MIIDDVIIIGAGPAGLAVAVQLQRYQIEARLFECSRPGGLLWNANLVENYPGFLGGISGPDLARLFCSQIREGNIIHERVLELNWQDNLFHVRTAENTYYARVAVVASGTKPRRLTDFKIPKALQGRLVYEIVDFLELRGKRFLVVGSGDAAFDYAINLAENNSVIILNRSQQVRCLQRLWLTAKACTNITYCPSTKVRRVTPCPEGGMTVECSSPHGQTDFHVDYLVGAIGREPQLDFVSASVLERSAELEKMGILHYVGDVKNGIFRQAAIAVGDGIRAGMHIYQTLKENADESNRFDG